MKKEIIKAGSRKMKKYFVSYVIKNNFGIGFASGYVFSDGNDIDVITEKLKTDYNHKDVVILFFQEIKK